MSLARELDRPPAPVDLEIGVFCQSEQLKIVVSVAGRPEQATRRLDPARATDATSPRLIALAAGELLYGIISAPPAAEPPGPESPPATPSRTATTVRRPRLVAVGAMGRAGQPSTWTGGLGLAFDYAPARAWALAANPLVEWGRHTTG